MPVPMSRPAIERCLRAVPLFAGISSDQLQMLATTARSLTVKKNARIFEEGAPADCCLVLTSGEAKVVLTADNGTELIVHVVRPNELVGELALLDGATRSAALIAVEPCHFIRIPATSFAQLRSNPAFENRLVAHVAATLRDANDQVRGISSYPAVARVAWCLGRIARQEGVRLGQSLVIPRKAHHELAEMIGCSRETVSRALATLKRKRCLSWEADTMRIEVDSLQRYIRSDLGLPQGFS